MFTGDTIVNEKGTVRTNRLLIRDKKALEASITKLKQYEVDHLCPGWGLQAEGKNILAGI